ncbi:FHA domain-containing serine/threonine-protein kinase [Deinococcus aquatilis]|uniref:FHA domain-containing serine/threonine-protein kinase n=1 Tax=Deinococcus aquatilis TaxID=519440 RepID=UPI0003617567|nr:FHA domain-containing serine/threonine-protein kinase [Deinococcus aquatilis]
MTTSRIMAQYQLLRSLGTGWLGEVYAATDLDDGKTYAVRVLADTNKAQAHLLIQLEGLLSKVMSLSHAHILPAEPPSERDNRVFYRMVLAERGSLRQLLQFQSRAQEPADLLVALDLLRQAASGLAYAHQMGLMHGNLKPENLLLQPGKALLGRGGYTLQLSDFGLADLRSASYGTHEQLGSSLTYLSPEQCRGVQGDPRSDLYALGVILYELVTGLVPFETRTAAEAFERHQYSAAVQPSRLRPGLPEDVEELILTCLAKRPEDRPASAAALEQSLQAIINRMLPSGPEPTVVLPPLAQMPQKPQVVPPTDRSPHPRLLIYGEDRQLLRHEVLPNPTATIGRGPGNDVVLDHAGISRHHLSLEFRPGQVLATDLNATNPSVMDTVPLPAMTPATWPYGELLYVRPYWLYLHAPYTVAAQPRIVVNPSVLELTLTPGVPSALPLVLANTGRTVDHFRLSVEGVPEHWIQNAHFEVQLNPGTQGPATLHILVPRTPDALAGEYTATVVARSRENPQEMGRAEMRWTVLPYFETQATLTPGLRRVWFRTRYDLSVTNGGNTPLVYSPTIADDEDAVRLLPRWQEVFAMPTSGNLSNIVNLRAVLSGIWMRLREGIGKIRVDNFVANVHTDPGQGMGQPMKVRVPIRWIGTTTHRNLKVLINADRHDPVPVLARLQHNPLIPLWLLPVLLVLLGLLGWWVTRPPEITAFALKGNAPLTGQAFVLNWDTSGARSVRLLPSDAGKNAALKGTGQLGLPGITQASTYTLVARGWLRESRRELTVTPKLRAAEIKVFTVSPASGKIGKPITVAWEVTNVDRVQLEPFGTVAAKGKQSFTLTKDVTVRLQADSGGGPVSRSTDVTVLPPSVAQFDLSAQTLTAGQTATLRWNVLNATNVTIDPIGPVPPQGSVPVSPTQNTSYVLRASNGLEDVQATAALTISARPPKITGFSVSPDTVSVGGNVTVTWSTSDAQTVQLTTASGTQSLPTNGSLPVSAPGQSGVFTLIATNSSGQQDTVSAGVNVLEPTPIVITPPPTPDPVVVPDPVPEQTQDPTPAVVATPTPTPTPPSTPAPTPAARPSVTARAAPPVPRPTITFPAPAKILAFRVDKPQITGAQPVTLSWQVQGVNTVRIQPLIGPLAGRRFPATGRVVLQVAADTAYTLVVGEGERPLKATAKVNFTAPRVVAAAPPPRPTTPPPTTATPTPAPTTAVPSRPTVAPRPTPATRPAATPAPTAPHELDGQWQHSFGSMVLKVNRTRVTGTFNFGERRDGVRGTITGSVFGSPGSYTVNARVTVPDGEANNISFVVRFSSDSKSFAGPYSERQQSERWCGWRPNTPKPQDCR